MERVVRATEAHAESRWRTFAIAPKDSSYFWALPPSMLPCQKMLTVGNVADAAGAVAVASNVAAVDIVAQQPFVSSAKTLDTRRD